MSVSCLTPSWGCQRAVSGQWVGSTKERSELGTAYVSGLGKHEVSRGPGWEGEEQREEPRAENHIWETSSMGGKGSQSH